MHKRLHTIREDFEKYAQLLDSNFKGGGVKAAKISWAAENTQELLETLVCNRWEQEDKVHSVSFDESAICFGIIESFLELRGVTSGKYEIEYEKRIERAVGFHVLHASFVEPQAFVEDLTGLVPQSRTIYDLSARRPRQPHTAIRSIGEEFVSRAPRVIPVSEEISNEYQLIG